MDGKQVPLKEIASIDFITGPAFIYREGSSRYVGVGFSIRDRDLGSTIDEAQKAVGQNIKLKSENKMVWAGEFESQQRHKTFDIYYSGCTFDDYISIIYELHDSERYADSRKCYAICIYRRFCIFMVNRYSLRYIGRHRIHNLVRYRFYR